MKIFAPLYYKKFKCIADRCRHSCCIGWEIDVDEDALSRFKTLGSIGNEILDSIDFSAEPARFRLTEDSLCPHLDENGLCRIISSLGEGYLCDICREHPRFYSFAPDRCEVGLGAACEEAARLILECEDYASAEAVAENGEEETETEFSPSLEREKIYAILSDRGLSFQDRLSRLYEAYGISPHSLGDGRWREIIASLEYLDSDNKELFLSYASDAAVSRESLSERALAYFIYRHTGEASDIEQMRLSLGAAFFLERLFSSVIKNSEDTDFSVLSLRKISEEIEYSEDNLEIIKSAYSYN